MHSSLLLAGVASVCSIATATPQAQTQINAAETPQQRAQAVKDAFEFAWNGYSKYAFPNDELKPVSNGFDNTRNGWGASAVDALSTAIVMQNKQIVNQIVNYIPTIDFSKSYKNNRVSLFETTIRYLGGMISGYDFLTGPLAKLATNEKNVQALLKQAETLANHLSFGFETKSGIPSNNLYFNNRSTDGSKTNGLATAGTLVLEWTRLADLTGNRTYATLAQKAESYLLNPKPATSQPFPGLVGTDIRLIDGRFNDTFGGWIGGDDSFYEYLIKMYVYDPTRFEKYKDRWILAADSSIKYLASHPSSRPSLTYLAEFNGTNMIKTSQHLACFDGGNYILGGTVLGRQEYIDFGLKLTEACHNTYTSTKTRIGPEVFRWDTKGLPKNQTAFYNQHGFWISVPTYDLRPEVIESYYHAYRATKDVKYQNWAWDAFKAINATCRAKSGFSSIANVNVAGGGKKDDFQESFLYAEVLKYSFLIFDADREWDVSGNGNNRWVYNTEAHPFKVAGPPPY